MFYECLIESKKKKTSTIYKHYMKMWFIIFQLKITLLIELSYFVKKTEFFLFVNYDYP